MHAPPLAATPPPPAARTPPTETNPKRSSFGGEREPPQRESPAAAGRHRGLDEREPGLEESERESERARAKRSALGGEKKGGVEKKKENGFNGSTNKSISSSVVREAQRGLGALKEAVVAGARELARACTAREILTALKIEGEINCALVQAALLSLVEDKVLAEVAPPPQGTQFSCLTCFIWHNGTRTDAESAVRQRIFGACSDALCAVAALPHLEGREGRPLSPRQGG